MPPRNFQPIAPASRASAQAQAPRAAFAQVSCSQKRPASDDEDWDVEFPYPRVANLVQPTVPSSAFVVPARPAVSVDDVVTPKLGYIARTSPISPATGSVEREDPPASANDSSDDDDTIVLS